MVLAGKLEENLFRDVQFGTVDTVRALLDQGADINARDNNGWTVLMAAVNGGKDAMVRLLLEKGADVNAKDKDGSTALTWAAFNTRADIMATLLDNGADPNIKDAYGGPLLVRSLMPFKPDVVRVLLAKGADPNAANANGDTALYWAVSYGYGDVVKALLAKGADPNARNNRGETPLSLAVSHGNTALVQLLKNPGGAGPEAGGELTDSGGPAPGGTQSSAGFLGVPWGAKRQQVDAAMAEKGYVKLAKPDWCATVPANRLCDPSLVNYDGMFAGERAELRFVFQDNALYQGWVAITGYRTTVLADQVYIYNRLKTLLTEKYGPPTREKRTVRPNGWGESAVASWSLTGDSGDRIEISVMMEGVLLADPKRPFPGGGEVYYTNQTLEKRLKSNSL